MSCHMAKPGLGGDPGQPMPVVVWVDRRPCRRRECQPFGVLPCGASRESLGRLRGPPSANQWYERRRQYEIAAALRRLELRQDEAVDPVPSQLSPYVDDRGRRVEKHLVPRQAQYLAPSESERELKGIGHAHPLSLQCV